MPDTGYLRFDTMRTTTGVDTTDANNVLSGNTGTVDMADDGDQVWIYQLTHSIPSDATIVGIEIRVTYNKINTGTITGTVRPFKFGQGYIFGDIQNFNISSAGTGLQLNYGGASDLLGMSLTPATLSTQFGIALRVTEFYANTTFQYVGSESDVTPAVKVHYTVPDPDQVNKWNGIYLNQDAIEDAGSDAQDSLADYDFTGQTRQTTSGFSETAGWNPSVGSGISVDHSGWANGDNACSASVWKDANNNNTPLIRTNVDIGEWFAGPNTTSTSRATASSNTGPLAGHSGTGNASDGASSAVTNIFLFSETSGSGYAHTHVVRTPGFNFSTLMSDTGKGLNLVFYLHAHGSSCGGFAIYIDTASTSKDADATLLRHFECRTLTTPTNPTTHVEEYVSGGESTSATSLDTYTFPRPSQTTGSTSDYARIEINLNSYRTINDDHYIYFVHSPHINSTSLSNIVQTGETSATWTSFLGDLAIDSVEIIESDAYGKTLDEKSTSFNDGSPGTIEKIDSINIFDS